MNEDGKGKGGGSGGGNGPDDDDPPPKPPLSLKELLQSMVGRFRSKPKRSPKPTPENKKDVFATTSPTTWQPGDHDVLDTDAEAPHDAWAINDDVTSSPHPARTDNKDTDELPAMSREDLAHHDAGFQRSDEEKLPTAQSDVDDELIVEEIIKAVTDPNTVTEAVGSVEWDVLEEAEIAELELEDQARETANVGRTAQNQHHPQLSSSTSEDEATVSEYLSEIDAEELASFQIKDEDDDIVLDPPFEEPSTEWQDPTEPLDGINLPDFDPNATDNPWDDEDDEDETADVNALSRAAAIASQMEFASIAEMRKALALLVRLFENFQAASTFGAFKRIANLGLDLPTLQSVIALRTIWAESSDWWYYRDYRGIRVARHGPGMMSWVLAYRIRLARPDFPPDMMIDPSWFEEWLQLDHGPGVPQTFTQYIEHRIACMDDYVRLETDRDFPPNADHRFISDSFYWNRSKSDEYERLIDPDQAVMSGDPSRPSRIP